MEPTGRIGRTLKPFIEDGLRQWVRNAASEEWFRKLMYVDKDGDGGGRIYFGPKGRLGNLPLNSGIAALTAVGGLAHVTIPGSPFATWVVNEMIDEVGPALRHAYENGRTPTDEELKKAQEKVKDLLQTKVLIVANGESYTMHHSQCFHPPVLQARPRIVRTYIDAAAMGARPTEDCPVCRTYLGGMLTTISQNEEARNMPTQSGKQSPADVLMQLSQEQRDRINDYIAQWEEEDPKASQLIDHLMLKLDTVAEAQLLATARSLREFKSLMRRTLEPKTMVASTRHAFQQLFDAVSSLKDPNDPNEPTVMQLEIYRTGRRSPWKKFIDLFRIF